MTGRLILVRHGETEGNVAKRLDTRLPGAPLTELGVTQAEAVGRRLAERAPAALVSSRALRAQQTASRIEAACIEAGAAVMVEVLDGLHEVQAGDLENRSDTASHETFKAVFHAWHSGDSTARPPGGESADEVLARYLPVVGELRSKYLDDGQSGDVVVVSHGAAVRLVGRHLSNVPGLFAANNHLDNTETVELLPTADGGWECVRWGRFDPPFADDVSPVADDPMG
ncbi:histidine phosphatase family protein [Antrihabitans sp. YC3-6]|uniref:Histidine phosphatase family protein n=1 Tax=Antrihabitans stalagmiti TaxID=2799499 RepID=A0A934U3Q7_9NOCA|nr:histidine phosphatase family protein [Antrihabitans stalagmiti]MBJ8339870.1 histidine phosphatase family protein [Antrihabitans stalagmiti]